MGWRTHPRVHLRCGPLRRDRAGKRVPRRPAARRRRAPEPGAGRRKSFKYLYDFGDSWWHSVKVEQIVKLDTPLEFARCIAGENACPPEDVGGAGGYEEFLEALADPDHPEHADLKEWIGAPFDPSAFDIDEVNARLNASE